MNLLPTYQGHSIFNKLITSDDADGYSELSDEQFVIQEKRTTRYYYVMPGETSVLFISILLVPVIDRILHYIIYCSEGFTVLLRNESGGVACMLRLRSAEW